MILGITLQEETGGTLSPPLPARFCAIFPRGFKSTHYFTKLSSCIIIIIALYHVSSQLLFSEDIDIIFWKNTIFSGTSYPTIHYPKRSHTTSKSGMFNRRNIRLSTHCG